MESQYDELILWVKPLGKVTKTAWLINEPINKKTEMDGYFATYPKIIKDLYSRITVESVSKIVGRISVSPGNVMEGDVSVYPFVKETLAAKILVSSHDTLHARIEMALENSMEGDVTVYGRGEATLKSNIIVSKYEGLPARIKLTPMNRMKGILDLQPIPRKDITLYPNKDSFVRDDIPRINYGTLSTMEVGKSVTPYSDGQLAEFKSLIQFDFSSLPNGAIVEKAKLILTVAQYKDVHDYLVETNDSLWAENTVAWVNKPIASNPSVIHDEGDSSHVVLDVLSYVKKWVEREGREENNGLVISLQDVTDALTFFTKEFNIVGDRPKLEMTYYDSDASYSIGDSQLKGLIRVRRDREHTLRGRIKITTSTGGEELPARIEVQNDGDLPSVIRVTRDELNAHIHVRRRDDSPLDAVIAIAGKDEKTLHSRLSVTREELISEIKIAVHDNLNATIQVLGVGGENLDAQLRTSRDFIIGTIIVPKEDTLNGHIVVQQFDKSQLPSKLRLANTSKLNAFMKVARVHDLNAHIHVQQTQTRQIPGIIRVQRFGEDNLKARIKVDYCSDLRAHLVVNSDYLPSVIYIAKSGEDELKATIDVEDRNIQKDLPAKVKVGHWNELHASIRVTSDYLPSTMSIQGYDNDSLDAKIQVASFLVKDLVSFLDLRNPGDLHSRIIIEGAEDTELSYVFIM